MLLFTYAYHTGIYALIFAMRLLAFFGVSKIKKGLKGRKDKKVLNAISKEKRPIIWLHAASLGEYEQGRALLYALRETYASYAFLLTFFSPSGYEHLKHHSPVDYLCYLPFDTPQSVNHFLNKVRPAIGIFIKYELWWQLLRECKRRHIPILLVSAMMREKDKKSLSYICYKKKALQQIPFIFTQNECTQKLLVTSFPEKNIYCTGDTRIDSVCSNDVEVASFPWLDAFKKGQTLFIAASIWRRDLPMLAYAQQVLSATKTLLVPHEPTTYHIRQIQRSFPYALPLSLAAHLPSEQLSSLSAIIIDSIGILAALYAHSEIVYVGGGWRRKKLHNVLEPARYGNSIIVGKYYEDFQEVQAMVRENAVIALGRKKDFAEVLHQLLAQATLREEKGKKAKNYISAQRGAVEKIMRLIQENRLLTN